MKEIFNYDKHFKYRIVTIFLMLTFFFSILILNLFRIQIVTHNFWSNLAYNQYTKVVDMYGERGNIISTDNYKFAYDLTSYKVIIDPIRISNKNIGFISKKLSKLTSLDYQIIISKIKKSKKRKSRFLSLNINVDLTQKNELYIFLKKHKLSSAIYFKNKLIRIYPKSKVLRSLLGFLNRKKRGVYGLEKYYDKYLEGKNGYLKDYQSTYIKFRMPVGRRHLLVKPQNGNNIILNINYHIQHILDMELRRGLKDSKAKSVLGIIADPQNGKILAMASYPIPKNIRNTKNRCIALQFEPGSVFKPLVVGYALDKKIISSDETFHSDSYIKVYNRILKDHDKNTMGDLSIKKILTHSSNVGMVRIGLKFKSQEFYTMLKDYGFGTKTNIDLPGEFSPYLLNYKKWDGLKIPTMSFGQGIVVTPIQMLMAFSAVINGGNLYKPEIAKEILGNDGKVIKKFSPKLIRENIISKAVSEEMRNYLQNVIEVGTGKSAKINGYLIGGKTGTAQKSGGRKGYLKGKYISTFIGFYPIDKPKLICLIWVNEPDSKRYYASQTCAPIFKNIFIRIFEYENIKPSDFGSNILDLNTEKKNLEKKILKKDILKL